MRFSAALTAALDRLATQSYEPQHVGKKSEPRRPTNINAGADSGTRLVMRFHGVVGPNPGFSTSSPNFFSAPHVPDIERKIQSANYHPRNRQNGCGNVRIDRFIQVMEQEPTLVRLNSSLNFKPVL